MLTIADFDFLAWANRCMVFPGDMIENMTTKCGIDQDRALELAYSGAIKEKRCLLALYQDYCQTPGPEQDAFMAYMTWAYNRYKETLKPETMIYADVYRGLPIGSVTFTPGEAGGWRFIPFTTAHQPSRKFWADMEGCIPTWALARRGQLMTKAQFNQKFPHHALK